MQLDIPHGITKTFPKSLNSKHYMVQKVKSHIIQKAGKDGKEILTMHSLGKAAAGAH